METALVGYRSALGRDLLSLYLFVFIADTLAGLIAPSLPVYAHALGSSTLTIGILNSSAGMTALLCAVPFGIASDVVGRRPLLLAGMLAWALATLTFSLAPTALLLLPGSIFVGVATILSFAIGAACLGDITSGRERRYTPLGSCPRRWASGSLSARSSGDWRASGSASPAVTRWQR